MKGIHNMATANRARESHSRFSKGRTAEEEDTSSSKVLALAARWNHPPGENGETTPVSSQKKSQKKKGYEGEIPEVTLTFNNCVNCGKVITRGYIGRWGESGTCTRECEMAQEAKPKNFGEPLEKIKPTTF